MSGLIFRKRAEPDQRIDLSILIPSRLAGLTAAQIASLPIGTTRRLVTVGDLFDMSGDDPATLRFEGGSHRFDRIGEGLDGGEIHVEGDAGWRAGRVMSAGRLTVTGSAGSFAGSAMSGGDLRIDGDAGDFLGGPLAGEMAGMSGGAIRVGGMAGERAADRMRRGTIVVAGALGANAASRMIAGTLIAGGRAAGVPGRLMKRGTLILAGGVERLSPTFLDNGPADLLILKLMAQDLALRGPVPFDGAPMRRFSGDTAVLGMGEIFLPL